MICGILIVSFNVATVSFSFKSLYCWFMQFLNYYFPRKLITRIAENCMSNTICLCSRNRLESNAEHWSALLLSLRELIEWVIRKDTELSGLGPPAGDTAALLKQQVNTSVLFHVLLVDWLWLFHRDSLFPYKLICIFSMARYTCLFIYLFNALLRDSFFFMR